MDDDEIYYEENEEEEGETGDEESSNRLFMIFAGGMFVLFACVLAMFGIWMFVLSPQREQARMNANATTLAGNAAVTLTVEAAAQIPPTVPPSPTHTSTPTLAPTSTYTPKPPTLTASPTISTAITTTLQASTVLPSATATVNRAATRSAVSSASTPTTQQQMAQTGIGSEVGLFVLAVGLAAVLFIARRLRFSQR